jgi:hypothetical protein
MAAIFLVLAALDAVLLGNLALTNTSATSLCRDPGPAFAWSERRRMRDSNSRGVPPTRFPWLRTPVQARSLNKLKRRESREASACGLLSHGLVFRPQGRFSVRSLPSPFQR